MTSKPVAGKGPTTSLKAMIDVVSTNSSLIPISLNQHCKYFRLLYPILL